MTRANAYRRRSIDSDFAEAWQDAIDDAVDDLEGIARKRALSGSDTLLIFLLKCWRPEVFRPAVRVSGTGQDGEVVVRVCG